jgi:hypothetical protein
MTDKITMEGMNEWLGTHFVTFKQTSVATRRPGVMARLIFMRSMGGAFKVTCGYDTLYEGMDFIEAQKAYNDKLPL